MRDIPDHVAGQAGSQVARCGAPVPGARTPTPRTTGDLAQALTGADAVIGFSGAGGAAQLTPDLIAVMARAPVVFALTDSDLQIEPDLLADHGAVVATGRPDHPNPINTMLAGPGLIRGALNARAPRISTAMQLAAADVLAGLVGEGHLNARRLLPHILDPQVVTTIAAAVAAVEASRRRAPHDTPHPGPEARCM